MSHALGDEAHDVLFRTARTHNGWLDKPVSDSVLRAVYDLTKWGPTSANSSPARFVFLCGREAKERLRPALMPGNLEKTMQAPVTVIIAHDLAFYDNLPKLFPHQPDAREWFSNSPELAQSTAFRNGTLQGAYLMLAARSQGLDCGPMSGFETPRWTPSFSRGPRAV